jgi:predicted metal-dependent HD superfamily phosphohydrolase
LVRLTEHHDPAPDDLIGQVLCDADLAILAAERSRYAAYVTGVRRDYGHISDADFAVGRAAVLRDLSTRARLFHTAYARERWEATARANLAAELETLAPQV